MVHWPEVMVTYDSTEKVLFSADGFGKFGALDVEEPWDDEARRYFIGIVGKYGVQVQNLLKVAATLDIQTICPLHGPVLTEDLGHYISLYDTWSSYTPEDDGIVIAYTSVYGHTKAAVQQLADKFRSKGCPNVVVYDLARDDMSQALSDAFRYSKLVLATTTYNASIYPFMNDFITRLVEHNFQNRTVGLIENGTWAPLAAKVMKEMLSKCKKINWLNTTVKIMSAVTDAEQSGHITLVGKIIAFCNVFLAELISHSFHLPAVFFVYCRHDLNCGIQPADLFAFGKHFFHNLRCQRCPGSVFNQSYRAVLEVVLCSASVTASMW